MAYRNPIVAGLNLIREAIRSPNFVTGLTGWSINKSGSAEFSDMIMRGLFRTGTGRVFIDDQLIAIFDPSDGTVYAIGFQPLKFWTGANLGGVIWGYNEIRFALSPGAPGQVLANSPVLLKNGIYKVPDQRHFQMLEGNASALLALTTVFVDIVGATVTFTTVNPNTQVLVCATIDNQVTTAIGAGGITVGQLLVDGVANAKNIIGDAANINRGHISNSWVVTLAAAGSHTIKLQARKSINAGVVNAQSIHTGLTVSAVDIF